MKRPAIFFDRDNTLIRNDGYLGDPAGVVLMDWAAEAIARLRGFGFVIVTFSNQSGVARGMFTEDAVRAVNQRMDELLRQQNPNAIIDGHEFCPYHPSGTVEEYRKESELRKPAPGMILKAAEAMDLDLSASWVIGDAPRDIEAGRAVGCKTILLHDPKLPPSEAAREAAMGEADYVVASLKRAVAIIHRHTPGLELQTTSAPTELVTPAAEAAAAPQPAPSSIEDPKEASANARQQKAAATLATRAAADPRRQMQPSVTSAAFPGMPQPVGQFPSTRLELLSQQILDELRRHRDLPNTDFAVSRLLGGVVQILAIAALFLSFLYRNDQSTMIPIMLLAIFLQVLTASLWFMGHQR